MKKAIIVGATSGIGKSLATLMAAEGYLVGITGRRSANLEAIKVTKPEAFEILSFDSVKENNTKYLDKLVERMGGLDILVMSAGIGLFNKELDYTLEKQTIDLNVSAFTEVVDWGYNYLKKNGGGQLVGISSIASIRGARQAPAYNASKSYQSNYLEGLRQKSNRAKDNIVVTDIRPGFVDTPMAKGPGMFWVAPVDKASKQIFSLIKKKRDIGYVTKRWRLMAWMLKLVPNWWYQRM